MTWRWLGGLALCVGLLGCVRLSPAYEKAATESGTGQQSSTTTGSASTHSGIRTSGKQSSSADSTAQSDSHDDTRGESTSMYGTSWALESSTGFPSDPPDCEPQEECGDEGSCPPQTQCSPYIEPKSGELATGCFTTGDRQWGEDCEAACAEVSSRCEEGLVCAVWRDDPVCATRCSANGMCGPGESCHAPEDLEPANGGCEPLGPCNLLKQDCPDGQDCVVQGGEAVCQPDFGDSAVGDYCEGSEVCASGLLCTSSRSCPEKGMCCMPLCDLNLGAPICACLDLELPGQPSAGVCTTLPEP